MDDWFVAQVEQHGPDIHAYLSRRTASSRRLEHHWMAVALRPARWPTQRT
jgi:hypothetical protein